MNGLSQFGKEWALVSQSMGGGKTAIQVKNYFQTNAEALGLEEIAEAATGDLVALLNGLEEDGISVSFRRVFPFSFLPRSRSFLEC